MKSVQFSTRIRFLLMSLAVAGGAAASGRTAHAGMIIDQQDTNLMGGLNTTYFSPVGQSFTPTLSSLDFMTFLLQDEFGNPATFSVAIYQGAGFGGPILGTSNSISLPIGFGDDNIFGDPVEFDFAGGITLTPGQVYTAELIGNPGNSYFVGYDDEGTYGGGDVYLQGGALSGADLVFQEGIFTATLAPEPTSLALCGSAGLVGLAVARIRRRRPA
jgi:hypothetical protein